MLHEQFCSVCFSLSLTTMNIVAYTDVREPEKRVFTSENTTFLSLASRLLLCFLFLKKTMKLARLKDLHRYHRTATQRTCRGSILGRRFSHFEWLSASNGIETATTPPSSWYTDPAFFERVEKQHTFKTWLNVARVDQVENEGDFVSLKVNQQPIIITKSNGEYRAFYNVCRHHAAQIVDDNTNGNLSMHDRFVCPYHGWEYNIEGRLTKAVKMKGCQDFSPRNFGLNFLPVHRMGPFLYLNFSKSGSRGVYEDVEGLEQVEGMLARTHYQDLKHVKSKQYVLDCNWKVFIDNYLDGGYHVPVAHKELSKNLDLSQYRHRAVGKFYLQTCPSSPHSHRLRGTATFSDDANNDKNIHNKNANEYADSSSSFNEALYIFQYPNICINRYGRWMDTNIVYPTEGGKKCVVHFDWYAHPSLPQEEIESSLKESEHVQNEDIFLCERVQNGVESDGYDTGRYAPSLEGGEFLFHQLLYKDLLASSLLKSNQQLIRNIS